MMEKLIEYFENIPLEELTEELKNYNVEFIDNPNVCNSEEDDIK